MTDQILTVAELKTILSRCQLDREIVFRIESRDYRELDISEVLDPDLGKVVLMFEVF